MSARTTMEQLALPLNVVSVPVVPAREVIYDPYWDEVSDRHTEVNFLVLEPPLLLPVPEQKLGLYDTQHRCNHDYYVLEQNALPEQVTQWVEIYSPSKRKKYEYYRYCWKCNGKIKHRHISGGNIQSPIPNARKLIIEQAIKNGSLPSEIEEMISNWSNSKIDNQSTFSA